MPVHTMTAQHSTAQHSTAQHSTAQHSTAQHSTAQHSTLNSNFFKVSPQTLILQQNSKIYRGAANVI
ncbi:MAG: hypothetical protein SPK98_07430 [Synergistales bacterium]|nr:hypothetical protein [Synergistales bacterium]